MLCVLRGGLRNPTIQRYFFNSSWMLAEQLLRIVAGVFVGIYIARYLGPEQFGVLSYVLALSTFVLTLARLGMDAVLVRELVDEHENQNNLIGTAFWLMVAAAITCYLVVGAGVWSIEEDTHIKTYAWIVSSSSFFTSFLVIDYLYQAQLKVKYSAICKTVTLFIMSLIKLGLIFSNAELLWFVIASVMDHALLAVFLLLALYKTHNISCLRFFHWGDARSMLRSAWPMVLTAVAALIFVRIDQVMIRNMLGLRDVGIYSAAVKIYESWIILPYVITISLLPAIVRLKRGDERSYQRRLTQLFRLLIWGSVAAAIFVFLISEPLIVIAFGEAYRESASVVNIVMWTAVFASIGSVSARYFNVERMEKKIALRTALAALLNVGLNFVLIPMYGVKGAAMATLACTFFAYYLMDWFDRDLRDLLRIKHDALFWRSL